MWNNWSSGLWISANDELSALAARTGSANTSNSGRTSFFTRQSCTRGARRGTARSSDLLCNDRALGKRTSYTHGTFSWVENATTDQEGAKGFYSALFGWDYDDSPVGNGVFYSMAKLRGQYVAAIAPQQQDERAMGVPPHW